MENSYDKCENRLYSMDHYREVLRCDGGEALAYLSEKGKRLLWRALYNAEKYVGEVWLAKMIWDNRLYLYNNEYRYIYDLCYTEPAKFAAVVEVFYNEDITISQKWHSKLIQEIINGHYRFLHKAKKQCLDKPALSFEEAKVFLDNINNIFSDRQRSDSLFPAEFWKVTDDEILVMFKNWIFGQDTILTYRLSQLAIAYQNKLFDEKEVIYFYKRIVAYQGAFSIGMEPQKFWSMSDEILGKAFSANLYLPCSKDFYDRICALNNMYNNGTLSALDVLAEFRRLLFLKDSFYITEQAEKRANAYADRILKEAKEYASSVGRIKLKEAEKFILEVQKDTLERAVSKARRIVHITNILYDGGGGPYLHISDEPRPEDGTEEERGRIARVAREIQEEIKEANILELCEATQKAYNRV